MLVHCQVNDILIIVSSKTQLNTSKKILEQFKAMPNYHHVVLLMSQNGFESKADFETRRQHLRAEFDNRVYLTAFDIDDADALFQQVMQSIEDCITPYFDKISNEPFRQDEELP